jgi:hypothetical protein
MGEKIGRSQADRQLFELTANDLRRHTAFAIEHLRHYLLMGDERKRRNIRVWLERGEIMMAADLKRDTPLREAFILALGDTVAKGKEGLKALREAQLRKYLLTLEAATYRGHGDHITESMRECVANP